MANNHPFGLGDSAEQSDNLAVQTAFAAASAATGLRAFLARMRASRLLRRYEQTWGEFVPNQAAQPV